MTPTMKELLTDDIAPDDYKHKLKCAIMELTPEQAEYVLWRLQCLRQENS